MKITLGRRLSAVLAIAGLVLLQGTYGCVAQVDSTDSADQADEDVGEVAQALPHVPSYTCCNGDKSCSKGGLGMGSGCFATDTIPAGYKLY